MELFATQFTDILLVQWLTAAPLAWLISRLVSERLRSLATVVSLGMVVFCWGISGLWLDNADGEKLWPLVLQQIFVSLPVLLALCLLAKPLARRWMPGSAGRTGISSWSWVTAGLLAILPAGVYQTNRVQSVVETLHQYQSQMRVGEFVALSRDLLTVAPSLSYADQPLDRFLAEWERQQEQMQQALTQVVDPGQKIRILAMLGERQEALSVLEEYRDRFGQAPQFCLLAGTILEHEQDWQESCDWYQRGLVELQKTATSDPKLLATAYRGIAFCQRKQGQNLAAETAYRQLLELEPTAEHHFLLAQFYQDTQVGQKAAYHLQQAVELDEAQYGETAAEMRSRLMSYQFSCFQVWRSGVSRSVGSGIE